MPQESFALDGVFVKHLRCDLNITQIQLGKRSKVARRTIQDIERNCRAVSAETARLLADALGVDVSDITLSKLLRWQYVPELASETAAEQLGRAIRLDMDGRHAEAVKICRKVLASLECADKPLGYGAAVVKLVTFLDHDGRHQEALEEVDRFLGEIADADDANLLDDAIWARYHRGICLRRLERFEEARAEFESILASKNADYDRSASHQLAVIQLEIGKAMGDEGAAMVDEANRQLLACLQSFERLDGTHAQSSHRKGFTLSRLGEIAWMRGRLTDAVSYYARALEVFSWNHCRRYVDGTLAELHAVLAALAETTER